MEEIVAAFRLAFKYIDSLIIVLFEDRSVCTRLLSDIEKIVYFSRHKFDGESNVFCRSLKALT
jgi:hypothetical protein